MPKLETKTFSSHAGALVEQPDLALIQTDSYEWFRKDGLKELFKEFSPITDYSDKHLELSFVSHYFDEPKYSEEEAKFKMTTYEAPLRARVRLTHKGENNKKKHKEQEVYLGDFPIMTSRGTFIINGVERIVISQLIRSPGAYFRVNIYRGKKLFGAKVIPSRGTWLEFETDSDGAVSVKIDRNRKIPATSLLRVFGMKDEKFEKVFGEQAVAFIFFP